MNAGECSWRNNINIEDYGCLTWVVWHPNKVIQNDVPTLPPTSKQGEELVGKGFSTRQKYCPQQVLLYVEHNDKGFGKFNNMGGQWEEEIQFGETTTIVARGRPLGRGGQRFEHRIETNEPILFQWDYPIPYYFLWDHSKVVESEYAITVNDLSARSWIRRGHVWREWNGYTQEIWYKEWWEGNEHKKELWIEWDRREREHVFIREGDGVLFRELMRFVRKKYSAPGYFWFKDAWIELSNHPLSRKLYTLFWPERKHHIWGQEFGFGEYPPRFWVKVFTDGEKVFIMEERIEDGKIVRRGRWKKAQ